MIVVVTSLVGAAVPVLIYIWTSEHASIVMIKIISIAGMCISTFSIPFLPPLHKLMVKLCKD
jgi:hypothetical protein